MNRLKRKGVLVKMMNEIANLISTVGFPIVMCILMLKQNSKQLEIIQNNTNAINNLTEEIRKGGVISE